MTSEPGPASRATADEPANGDDDFLARQIERGFNVKPCG